jgi:hypothetical protein
VLLEREAFLDTLAGPLGPLLDVAEAAGGELLEVTAAGARPPELVAALLRELRATPATVLVLEDLHWADAAQPGGLTAREIEVLRLVAEG